MYRLISLFAIAVLSPLFMAQSCEKSCKQATCTDIFAMVTVYVEDAQHEAVVLDEAYTIRKGSGEKIALAQENGDGHYVVLDDSYRSKLENIRDEFRFVGTKRGAVLVDETFIISADCCHVQKVSGSDTAVVQ